MRIPLPLLAIAGLLLSGCFYSREIADTRREIERQHPDLHLKREMVLNLGPVSLRTARWFLRFADDDAELARTYMRDIRRVKVGIYRVEDHGGAGDTVLPELSRMQLQGWETAVRVQEDGESTWLLFQERRGQVADLYVMALDGEELVLVRLEGRLSRIMERMMSDEKYLDAWTDQN